MEMIYLDRNENNYGPAPACLDVLKNEEKRLLNSYSDSYKRGVKSDLSDYLAKQFAIEEDRVVLGYGAEDLLKQIVQCYLTPGKKLMIPTYSWWYYKKIAEEVNGINVEYPLVQGTDSFHYDVDQMRVIAEREKPDMVFLSSPNNPTGNSISQSDLEQTLDYLEDTIVALDEAYWNDQNTEQAKKLIDRYPNLIIIRTFSKYYALAGVRIGYGLLGKNLAQMAKHTNRYLGYNLLSEKIALAALNSSEYYQMISLKMKADKERYYAELGVLPGFTVYKSDANFVLVKIPREIYGPLNESLKAKGLVIKFMNEEILNSHLRISLGTQEQNDLVINSITQFMQERIR